MPSAASSAPTVAVIGGGPGGLMAAERLAERGAAVTVYERMPSVGRKFLLAGRGGLNLTHSEPLDDLLERYGAARPQLEGAIRSFDATALRSWCEGLGEPTFVGSSGRVFPSSFRATPLLRAWLARLEALGVQIRVRHHWTGWADDGALTFTDADEVQVAVRPDVTVLALGGASWPKVGSNAAWVGPLEAVGVSVTPLRPANCGFSVSWTATFSDRFAGVPLKNIRLNVDGVNGVAHSVRGEAMVTESGVEGGAFYAAGAAIRDRIEESGDGTTVVHLDLHPDLTAAQIVERLRRRRLKDSQSSTLRKAVGLQPVSVGLLREAAGVRLPADDAVLAELIKSVPVRLVGVESIDRAISTAGGVAFDEIDDNFMLRHRPGTFVVGEMLDWEAPTGGYLLQATFSSAVMAAGAAADWLDQR